MLLSTVKYLSENGFSEWQNSLELKILKVAYWGRGWGGGEERMSKTPGEICHLTRNIQYNLIPGKQILSSLQMKEYKAWQHDLGRWREKK